MSYVSVLLLAALLSLSASAQGPLPPTELKVEAMAAPMTVDVLPPRMSWIPVHTRRGASQSAYQILVSRNPAIPSGDVWDSGKVSASRFTHIPYAGPPLMSGETYYWKVRYWDDKGQESPFSRPATFGMGLLQPSDWKAQWIAGGNALRKEFSLAAAPQRAKLFIAAVGYYELRINGEKVGNHVLDPANTPYAKRILYEAYEVTPLLRQGPNAIGLLLGEGWFKDRMALVQLHIQLAGGQTVQILSDATWQAGRSPIVEDSIYHGETYDARLEQPGWDLPGFSAPGWNPAVVKDSPTRQLSGQLMEPIRVTGEIPPRKMWSPKPGVYVYDMGQNFSGWVRLKVRGPRGATVRIRHAELIYDNGMLNVENLRSARATDVYILKGDGEEIYEPRFTYHGFRYVELTGYPGVPPLSAVTGRIVHSDVKPHGGFAASNELLNRIQHLVQWGIRSNLHSIPTDCNQRDERMGWMADAHLYAEAAIYTFDMQPFFITWLRSIRDEQAEDGSVPDTVPRAAFARGPADPAWGAAYPLILWYAWQQYGDRRLLEEHYDGIRKWSDFLWGRSENGILNFVKFGDWVPVEKTPGNLVSTAFSYWSADIVSQVAQILGRDADASAYRDRAEKIKAAFHQKFYHPDTASYGNGSQTSYVLPLYLNLVPKEVRNQVQSNLRHELVYRWDSHLTTGILGTKYLLPLVTRFIDPSLAYDIATKTDYPSWGYMIANGATTLWELWQKKEGPSMNSHNHPMFGSIGGWFITDLAGIDVPAPGGEGYAAFTIKPVVTRDLWWVTGSFDTVRGRVSSSWRRDEGSFTLEVTVPFGATTTVVIPKLRLQNPTLSEQDTVLFRDGKPAGSAPGIAKIADSPNALTLECGSGAYRFLLRAN